MSDTKISWTDKVWNPIRGCSIVSKGCTNCYAMKQAHRFSGPGKAYEGLTKLTNGGPVWTGDIRLVPEKLEEPLRWKKPARIFVASMGDPHHAAIPDHFRDKMLAIIMVTPQHTYQWLTKRAKGMRDYFCDSDTPYRVQREVDALLVNEEMRGVQEVYRDVPGFEGHYQVSNYGAIRSKTGRPLGPRLHGKGYRSAALSKHGKVSEVLVHRVVLETFIGPAPHGLETCHRNRDRGDNRIANLRWGTRADNMADSSRHGTAGVWMKGQATLTEEQVVDIRRRRASGEKLDDIAAAVGSNRKQVSAVARGTIFKPVDGWPLPNVWLGVSVENQETADERIPLLLETPAAVRWLSCEPMLDEIDLESVAWPNKGGHRVDVLRGGYWNEAGYRYGGKSAELGEARGCFTNHSDMETIDWVVVGGESGTKARPMNTSWALDLADQCRASGVPFFMKQGSQNNWPNWRDVSLWPKPLQVREYPE